MSTIFDFPGTANDHRGKRTITYAKRRNHDRQKAAPGTTKVTASTKTDDTKAMTSARPADPTPKLADIFDFPASDHDAEREPVRASPLAKPIAKSSSSTKRSPVRSAAVTPHAGTKRKQPLPPDGTRSEKRRSPEIKLTHSRVVVSRSGASPAWRVASPNSFARADKQKKSSPLDPGSPHASTTPQRPTQPAPTLTRTPSAMTPKQRSIWGELLAPIESLRASKSVAAKSNGRVRMVDRLKAAKLTVPLSSESDLSDTDVDSDAAPHAPNAPPRVALTRVPSSFTQSRGESQQSQSQGTKRTYGGTRSYLQDVSVDLEADLLGPPLESPVVTRAGLSSVDEGEDDNSQAIRSIHELRAAGARNLFSDDMDALVYDFKTHTKDGWSRRRAALMTLADRLKDKTFVHRLYEHNYDDAICGECSAIVLNNGLDSVGDTILLVCLTRLLQVEPQRHVLSALLQTNILTWTLSLVDKTESMSRLAKDRKSNMAKSSQADFLSFMSDVATSGLFESCKLDQLSRGAVALACVDSIVKYLRNFGSLNTMELSSRDVSRLITISMSSGDPWLSTKALNILEAHSLAIASDYPIVESTWTDEVVEKIASSWSHSIGADSASDQYAVLLLRLCLNLSNNNENRCELLGRPNVVDRLLNTVKDGLVKQTASPATVEITTKGDAYLDILLLSLGLVINLVEYSSVVRAQVAAKHTALLTSLVEIFNKGHETASSADSLEQSRANVAHGYLSVLLGNFCLDAACKDIICSQVPNGDMSRLSRAVMEFVQYHEQVDQLALEGESVPVSGWQQFTSRLMGVVEHIN